MDFDSLGNLLIPEIEASIVYKYFTDSALLSCGDVLDAWGVYGGAEGQFSYPMNLDLDASDNLYVADWKNHRVQKFDADGNFILMWGYGVNGGIGIETCTSGCTQGIPGSNPGQFQAPKSIAVDSFSNRVYVGDSTANRINVYDLNGDFLDDWSHNFSDTWGIDIDWTGNVYAVNPDYIWKYRPDGILIERWGPSGDDTTTFNGRLKSLGIGPDNSVYVHNFDACFPGGVFDHSQPPLWRFSYNGILLDRFGACQLGPLSVGKGIVRESWDIHVDPSGIVNVADRDKERIVVFDEDGNKLTTMSVRGFPGGVAVGNGIIGYVSEVPINRIDKFVACGIPDDGDGIAYVIDTEPTILSNMFDDRPLAGTTYGQIIDRGGWEVTIVEIPGGVRVSVSDSGDTAIIQSCDIETQTFLDQDGEAVDIICGSTTATAVNALPDIVMRRPFEGTMTVQVKLGTGQTAAMGPILADPGNTTALQLEVIDEQETLLGDGRLDPGQEIDVQFPDGAVVLTNLGDSAISFTMDENTFTLQSGDSYEDTCAGEGGPPKFYGCSKMPKVRICHRTDSITNPPYVTIEVSRNGLSEHLGHGDSRGPCDEGNGEVPK